MNIVAREDLGWIIAIWLLGGIVLSAITTWFASQYEIIHLRRFGTRVARRWYGTRAHVSFRSDADLDDPAWFQVLEWTDENTDVPWVLIAAPDDEELPPCWCPVTDLAPYSVRRLRPWIFRYHWLRIPVLFSYVPLRQPAGYLEGGA